MIYGVLDSGEVAMPISVAISKVDLPYRPLVSHNLTDGRTFVLGRTVFKISDPSVGTV